MDNRSMPALKTIEADTYDDCLHRLRAQYADNFAITGKREKPPRGIKWLIGVPPRYEVTYYETPGKAPSAEPRLPSQRNDDLERQKILQFTGGMTGGVPQVAAKITDVIDQHLDDRFDAMTRVFTEKIEAAVHAAVPPVPGAHPAIDEICALLEANEYTPAMIRDIASRLKSELSLEKLADIQEVKTFVSEALSSKIKVTPPLSLSRAGAAPPRVIALVGPTGEGKTTTVAKLALQALQERKDTDSGPPRVALITTDTFRIGAASQIETYARTMEMDYFSAPSAEAVRGFLADHSGAYDLILVDTTGCGAYDFASIGKTRQVLELPELKADIYLVVSAGKKAADLADIFANYAVFRYRAVVVTKMDETHCYGNVVCALAANGVPVVYTSDGQSMKKHLIPGKVADFLGPFALPPLQKSFI